MRGTTTVTAAVALCLAAAAANAADGSAAGRLPTQIPAENLAAALASLANVRGIQVVYRSQIVQGLQTRGASGNLTTDEALRTLLVGTGLTYRYLDSHTVTLDRTAYRAADPAGARTARAKSAAQPRKSASDPDPADPQQAPPPGTATNTSANAAVPGGASSESSVLQEVVVTGTTSQNRTVLTSSSDIIPISPSALATKAPRSTDQVLEAIPGMFVEDTAGPESNNYSVRGLPGGGQTFINFEEDGLPIAYPGTGNPDELFTYDINVDRVEAVLGGNSGVLTPNAAAASVNFITRKPDFDHTDAIAQLSATTYGERRADMYYSAPITDGLAFNVGGYIGSTHGERNAGFTYDSYQFKGALEKRFDDGAWVRLTGKFGVRHDPYYADMPFNLVNGTVSSIPGTDALTTNIGGPAFGDIGIPNSCYASPSAQGNCYRDFSLRKGIEVGTHQVRLDFDVPVAHGIDVFGKMRYLRFDWDFNGLFPGSGSGNAGLTSASDYLNGGSDSPIASLLTAGAAAYPGATFGIRDLTTGQIISAADTAALNALNGNGLLQQTWLNQQEIYGHDFASNVGVRWRTEFGPVQSSLTAGAMYFDDFRYNDQSAVANVINGVAPQSHIYDVVALNAAGQVVGNLTDHGLVDYGDWGEGVWKDDFGSLSGYLSDELTVARHWHIDLGLRSEGIIDHYYGGNAASAAAPVPVGFSSIPATQGNEFNGAFSEQTVSHGKTAKSIGVNYTFDNNLALYGQYAFGFQQSAGGGSPAPAPTSVDFAEVGARYATSFLFVNGGVFQTKLLSQTVGCFDPNNPSLTCQAFYDVTSRGIEYQLSIEPLDLFLPEYNFVKLNWTGVFQDPKLTNVQNTELNSSGVVVVPLQSFPLYNGNVDNRTPRSLQTLEAQFRLPRHLGQIYLRGQYFGSFFADVANDVRLPAYWTLSAGVVWNATEHLTVNLSGNNLTNSIGLTEGNPRQGTFTEQVVNGTFYGRSIFGRNGMLILTYDFGQ